MPKSEHRGVPLNTITVLDFSGGVQAATTPALTSDKTVIHCLNGDIQRKIGGISGRCGSTLKKAVGAVVKSIKTFYNNSTRYYIVVASDGSNEVIYTLDAGFIGTLTSKKAAHFTDDVSVYSETIGQNEMFFNGIDAPQQWTGAIFSNITNAPVKGKFPAVYQQRLYVLTTDSFLYYSDVVNATGDGFTTTAWTNRGLNPNDGQEPKALVRHRSRLLAFKTESIYRYDGSNEPEPIINIGTHSERGVVLTDMLAFFHHPTGIFQMGLGDPEHISQPVNKYLSGMNPDNWSKVSTERDNSNVYFWIGDVTINEPLEWDYRQTYTDVTLVYNFLLRRWSVYTGWNATTWFRDKTNGNLYFVKSDGSIVLVDPTVYSDEGRAIDFQVRWAPITYGVPNLTKTIDHLFIDGSSNMNLKIGPTSKKVLASSNATDTGLTEIKQQIAFKKLWILAHAAYTKHPPFIEQLYIGKAYAGNKL